MRGGRNLWESKNDRKWGHDKFEEMTLQEKQYKEGRASRGRYRVRSKNRVPSHGYPRESRPRAFGKSYNQNQAPKAVRGRGSRRYEPSMKNSSQAPPVLNKLSGKTVEKISQANSSRGFTPATNANTVSNPAKKHIFASSLSSASPPFYPSGSSKKNISFQKKDVQAGSVSKDLHQSVTNKIFSVFQSNSLQGKNAHDSLSMAKLYIDDSTTSASVKPLTNVQMLPSGSSLDNSSQPSQSRVQDRDIDIPPQHNQVNRASPPAQVNAVQRIPVQGRGYFSVQAAAQQLGQHPGIGSRASSPPETSMSVSSYESGEVESSDTSKPDSALASKGKNSLLGAGRGSYLYGGAQIIGTTGNMSISHGDQNFPAFLPVMQFGDQHSSGLSVPAVGMAFPGYVAQPQLGMRNSEMTWLPVLTGAAGALGTTYCPPYFAFDGAYNTRSSGQTSTTGSSGVGMGISTLFGMSFCYQSCSKENTSNKPNNEWKPSPKPGKGISDHKPVPFHMHWLLNKSYAELASDELGQQQNNPNKQSRRQVETHKLFLLTNLSSSPVVRAFSCVWEMPAQATSV
ncbi:CASC3/Barentsz eIF4AIII binding, putative isoform 7 [Hibiscus syriacus]|uniref:CASC3/Barentsz eIF4AIII binding, putative isoform 7 n=1 Tax=Hibiscus syriacus TaxID=106335 RepID=A0A6A2WRQ4_HIBSY|nr:CASC3/Barentsz eIF4AIII binding, putative isoform 7 [Hibiscus syriacus]